VLWGSSEGKFPNYSDREYEAGKTRREGKGAEFMPIFSKKRKYS